MYRNLTLRGCEIPLLDQLTSRLPARGERFTPAGLSIRFAYAEGDTGTGHHHGSSAEGSYRRTWGGFSSSRALLAAEIQWPLHTHRSVADYSV